MIAGLVIMFGVSTLIPAANAVTISGGWATKAPRPAGGEGLGIASIGTVVYAVGGLSGFNRNDAYATTTDTWTSEAPLPIGINQPAGVVSVSGRMYVISGITGVTCTGGVSRCMTNAVQVYDASTNTWSTVAPIPTPRSRAGVVVLGSKIYVIGGYQLLGTSPPDPTTTTGPALNVVEVYDFVANSWTTVAPMPTGREGLLAAAVGEIFAFGGLTTPRDATTATSTAETYDPPTNTWATIPAPMPTPRGILMGGRPESGSFACLNDNFVIGGVNSGSGTLNTNEAYANDRVTWDMGAVMLTARAGGGAAVVQNTIYVVGGFTDHAGGVQTNVNEAYTPICGGGSVGGVTIPIDKLALLAPYFGFASITAATILLTIVYLKRTMRKS